MRDRGKIWIEVFLPISQGRVIQFKKGLLTVRRRWRRKLKVKSHHWRLQKGASHEYSELVRCALNLIMAHQRGDGGWKKKQFYLVNIPLLLSTLIYDWTIPTPYDNTYSPHKFVLKIPATWFDFLSEAFKKENPELLRSDLSNNHQCNDWRLKSERN